MANITSNLERCSYCELVYDCNSLTIDPAGRHICHGCKAAANQPAEDVAPNSVIDPHDYSMSTWEGNPAPLIGSPGPSARPKPSASKGRKQQEYRGNHYQSGVAPTATRDYFASNAECPNCKQFIESNYCTNCGYKRDETPSTATLTGITVPQEQCSRCGKWFEYAASGHHALKHRNTEKAVCIECAALDCVYCGKHYEGEMQPIPGTPYSKCIYCHPGPHEEKYKTTSFTANIHRPGE